LRRWGIRRNFWPWHLRRDTKRLKCSWLFFWLPF